MPRIKVYVNSGAFPSRNVVACLWQNPGTFSNKQGVSRVSEIQKKPLYKRWWVWTLGVVIVAGVMGGERDAAPGGKSGPALPAAEANFVSLVSSAQKEASKADNDMQRGGIKAKRDQGLCKSIQGLGAQDWVGKVTQIGANSDGKGVFAVELAKDITVKTWNNDFSDIMHKTLFQPGSPLFNTASNLKKGQMVKFSGTFFKGTEGDCVYESSLGLRGKLMDPEFIFRFSSITPL